ncbi:37295_t:CDS:2 [Gigaspora margarita]|uniref:37295_t:CDS:1 n=1 Tax=Gigaspora margarita TaxID=4874 RepID=A0ABN7UUW9_GIGMA|nr:37295_t:CDS:2 [Gigaspora margarita]
MCSKKELPKNLSDASFIPKQEIQEQFEYKTNGKLKFKIAIITKGDSGIGRSVTVLFALEGCEGKQLQLYIYQ